jgi:hypothetical protein
LPVEVVPKGEQGNFHLLYLPPWTGSEEECRAKVREEYQAIRDILRGALCTYGFSAKKADGWGCIKEPFPGSKLMVKKGELQPQQFQTFGELTDILTKVLSS